MSLSVGRFLCGGNGFSSVVFCGSVLLECVVLRVWGMV